MYEAVMGANTPKFQYQRLMPKALQLLGHRIPTCNVQDQSERSLYSKQAEGGDTLDTQVYFVVRSSFVFYTDSGMNTIKNTPQWDNTLWYMGIFNLDYERTHVFFWHLEVLQVQIIQLLLLYFIYELHLIVLAVKVQTAILLETKMR